MVVGAGIGGLTAAACLARGGRKILIVDRLDGPGGLAHAFHRGAYVFDPALHITTGFEEGEIGDAVLRTLGVRDQVQFVEVDCPHAGVYPDVRFVADRGLEPLIESYARACPGRWQEIEAFLHLCNRVYLESRQIGFRSSVSGMDELVRQFPTFFQYRNAVAADVLADIVGDVRARAICLTIWPYMGVPPERLPLTQLPAYLIGLGKMPLYCQGGFQRLADALASAVARYGGVQRYGSAVTEIGVRDDSVIGVTLEDGSVIRAPVVISNADGRRTFDELVGRDHVPPSVLRRLDRLTPSLSAFVVFAVTTLDLSGPEFGYETFLYEGYDHSRAYSDAVAGRPSAMWITAPSRLDRSLAPPGTSVVTLTVLVAHDIGEDWAGARERFTKMILDRVERVLPGFRDSLLYVESATPTTIESLTLAQHGAVYGWELSLTQLLTKRLRQDTGIGGLYLAGHWTEHGASGLRVLLSGATAAQKVLGYPHLGAMIDGFG